MYQIAIDIDNTIINYEPIFQKICRRFKLNPQTEKSYKNFIKNTIYDSFTTEIADKKWQRIQAAVYGNLSSMASLYDDALLFIETFSNKITLVSHKTLLPYSGFKSPLQEIALDNLCRLGVLKHIRNDKIIMFQTLDEKINYLNEKEFNLVVDDLFKVLILLNNQYSTKVLFSNDLNSKLDINTIQLSNWSNIIDWFELISSRNIKKVEIEKIHGSKNTCLKILGEDNIFIKFFNSNDVSEGRLQREYLHHSLLCNEYKFQKNNLIKMGISSIAFKFYDHKLEKEIGLVEVEKIKTKFKIMAQIKNDTRIKESSDSLFNYSDYWKVLEKRMAMLGDLSVGFTSEIYEKLKKIIELEVSIVKTKLKELQIDENRKISNRCFCFSDFSSENLILTNDELYFIDFESTGYDDSVKMVNNLYFHPINNFNDEVREELFSFSVELFNDDENEWINRFNIVSKLLQLNWLCIVLKYAQKSTDYRLFKKMFNDYEVRNTIDEN